VDRDQFLDYVAHELKTPLTPLKAAAQLMRMRIERARDGGRALDTAALDKNAAMVERQVDRMDRLVTGVLEVTRIARGRFALGSERFDVAEAVREVAADVADALEEGEVRHRIDVETPGPLWIQGDGARVTHVIHGLLENAVKFSPQGGTISVRLEGRDGDVTLTVRDEGIGIAASDLESLGRAPFERPERTSTYAGLGSGLYLARVVAEGHGGRLEVSSEGTDRGTTVRLALRDARAEDSATG
jgi:signal transduction histidine kinase